MSRTGDITKFKSSKDSKGFTRIATEMTQQGWGDAIFIRSS